MEELWLVWLCKGLRSDLCSFKLILSMLGWSVSCKDTNFNTIVYLNNHEISRKIKLEYYCQGNLRVWFAWREAILFNCSYGLHTSFINSLVHKKKNIHAIPIKCLKFGLCHTFKPRPWKHGFAFTPQAWRYDTNQTLSIKIQSKRMISLQQELGRAWANPGSPLLL